MVVLPREVRASLMRFQLPSGDRERKEDARAATARLGLRVAAPRIRGCRMIPQPPPPACRYKRRPSLWCRDRHQSGSGKNARSPPQNPWHPRPSVALVANVELELPALFPVTGDAPELERADLCYA